MDPAARAGQLLPPDQRDRLTAEMRARWSREETARNSAIRAVEARADGALDLLKKGMAVSPAELDALIGEARAAGADGLAREIETRREVVGWQQTARQATTEELRQFIAGEEAAMRADAGLLEAYERMRPRRGPKRAIVALARRMCHRLLAMARTGECYRLQAA